jgi:hypothetical protein
MVFSLSGVRALSRPRIEQVVESFAPYAGCALSSNFLAILPLHHREEHRRAQVIS